MRLRERASRPKGFRGWLKKLEWARQFRANSGMAWRSLARHDRRAACLLQRAGLLLSALAR